MRHIRDKLYTHRRTVGLSSGAIMPLNLIPVDAKIKFTANYQDGVIFQIVLCHLECNAAGLFLGITADSCGDAWKSLETN